MSKILLIEDDQAIADLYNIVFTKHGFIMELAFNGQEGLEKLKNYTPDIILLDVMMPKMNGAEFLKIVKADPDLKKIPVIVLSNLSEKTMEEAMLGIGAEKFIIKGQYIPAKILQMVEDFLASRKTQ